MKQVICIYKEPLWWNDTTETLAMGPLYNEICTVEDEVTENGILGYILAGYPDRGPFISSLFIPLSNRSVEIAEEVMERELVET